MRSLATALMMAAAVLAAGQARAATTSYNVTSDVRITMNDSVLLDSDEYVPTEGCPCPTCEKHTRAYVHYLSRAEEMTGVRLLALHNLAYLERLVRGAREAIHAGGLARFRGRILGGAPPWSALTAYGS